MQTFRTLLLLLICCFSYNSAINCPIRYKLLHNYSVDIPSGYVTADELKDIKIENVKDSLGQVDEHFNILRAFFISGKQVGSTEYIFQEYFALRPNVPMADLIDTLLNKLNLQDTVSITYFLSVKYKNDGDAFFRSIDSYKIQQTFILASQAVVDLKRNVFGNAFVAYPSPASNHVSVKLDIKESKNGKLILYNALGQELQSAENHNLMQPYTFKLDEYTSGVFYIHAIIDGEYFMKKIIKD